MLRANAAMSVASHSMRLTVSIRILVPQPSFSISCVRPIGIYRDHRSRYETIAITGAEGSRRHSPAQFGLAIPGLMPPGSPGMLSGPVCALEGMGVGDAVA